MHVRYYILPFGQRFKVLREGRPQGIHDSRERALDSAAFMASVEAARMHSTAELLIADELGRLHQARIIAPGDQDGLRLPVTVGPAAADAAEDVV